MARPRRGWRPLAVALATLVAGVGAVACSSSTRSTGPRTINVPADESTISAAVERARPGDLVLVAAGTYRESVTINRPDVTLRGLDRNTVIIDGEGLRPQGVLVVADGVRVENLTVRGHTFNGVLVTGLHDGDRAEAHGVTGYTRLDPAKYPPIQRFAITGVTATNNGLYGLYAFDAQHGSITDSYASGSADSGIYVGQCQQCDILVAGNVAERNAVGFELANASDSVVITGNRFSSNRVGMTLLSNYQEAFTPQRGDQVIGNVVVDNDEARSPAQADGAFGLGIGISGGRDNAISRNVVQGNPWGGVVVNGTEDLAATGNSITGNQIAANGVDLADLSSTRAPSSGNCFSDNGAPTAQPPTLVSTTCPPGTAPGPGADPSVMPTLDVPDGMSFLKVPPPPAQPQMAGDLRVVPTALPATVAMPDLTTLAIPTAALLADRTLQ